MKRVFIFVAALVIFVLILPHKSFASSQSIGVYPPIIRIKSLPGKTQSVNINITNYSTSTETILLRALPFSSSNPLTGQITYSFNSPPIAISSLDFKTLELTDLQNKPIDSITLNPLSSKQIKLTITPREGYDHKDYYFSLIALTAPQTNQEALNTVLGVSTDIFISVDPAQPQAEISQFTSPHFLTSGPVTFSLLVRNSGDSLFSSGGTIQITNFLGQAVGNIPLTQNLILAHSSRFLQVGVNNPTWNEPFLFGIYTAKAIISVNGQKEITAQRHFLAIPLLPLIIIIIIVLFILSIYLRVIKKIYH